MNSFAILVPMRTLVVVLTGAVLALSIPASAHAFLPFGGLITAVSPCPTGAGTIAVIVAPPPYPSGPYAILPKTISYPVFIHKPGSFILGLFTPVANVCGASVIGTVYLKGTSL